MLVVPSKAGKIPSSRRKRSRPKASRSESVPKSLAPSSPGTTVIFLGRWKILLKAILIVGAGIWVLSPTLHNTWSGDDDLYLTANSLLQSPDRVWKAWFQPGSFTEYYPIEQTVQWCQWRLWGLASPFPYLVCNLVLHLTSALLIWHLFSKLGLRLAWLGGLIFAIYPLMVDSVGVSSELKNTLSLPPFLLAMIFYLKFENSRKLNYYLLALLLFFAAMFCKITMAFFPAVILLYAWWKRGRVAWRDATEAAPFFVISIVLSFVTIHAGAVYAEATHYVSPGPIHLGGFFERIALAGLCLGFYFGHCFFPPHLMPLYPLWPMEPLTPWHFAPWLGIALLFGWCWTKRRSWGRPALFGLGFFVLALAPFLGLNQVSYMCLCWVQDHFVYIPILGLIGLFVAGVEHGGGQLTGNVRPFAVALLVFVLGLMGFQTYSYAKLFSDHEKLWRDNLRYNPHMWLLEFELGMLLNNDDRYNEASEHLQDSIQANPNFANAHFMLGLALLNAGRQSEGIDALATALRIVPQYESARHYLILALLKNHRLKEARVQLNILLESDPDSAWGHYYLGYVFALENRIPQALTEWRTARRLDPTNEAVQQVLAAAEELSRRAPSASPPFLPVPEEAPRRKSGGVKKNP
jgi:cytochrome c-type biogenesis protein CcmH/NrfG